MKWRVDFNFGPILGLGIGYSHAEKELVILIPFCVIQIVFYKKRGEN